jgi:hypothetical protein
MFARSTRSLDGVRAWRTAPRRLGIALAFLAVIASGPAFSQDQQIRGKVVMADGSPLPKAAQIERSCGGRVPVHLTSTNAKGEFVFYEAGITYSQGGLCVWRAVLPGYDSTEADMEDIQRSTILPNFVLHHAGEEIPEASYFKPMIIDKTSE